MRADPSVRAGACGGFAAIALKGPGSEVTRAFLSSYLRCRSGAARWIRTHARELLLGQFDRRLVERVQKRDQVLDLPHAPETFDSDAAAEIKNSKLLTPYRALATAVRNEERAFAFWSYLAAFADDPPGLREGDEARTKPVGARTLRLDAVQRTGEAIASFSERCDSKESNLGPLACEGSASSPSTDRRMDRGGFVKPNPTAG